MPNGRETGFLHPQAIGFPIPAMTRDVGDYGDYGDFLDHPIAAITGSPDLCYPIACPKQLIPVSLSRQSHCGLRWNIISFQLLHCLIR